MVTFIKSKNFLLILLLLVFVSSSTAFALEIDWPLSPGGTVLNDDSDVGDMVQYFYEWAIALGGLATFVSLVLGGFKYLSSMGRPEAMKDAREQITSAFAGLVLLLSAWLILNIINPDLTTFKRESYNLDHIKEQYDSFQIGDLPSCDYVELYPNDAYGGGAMVIEGKESETPPKNRRLTIEDGYREMRPLSSRAFTSESLPEFDCPDPDPVNGCPCPEYGCGCVLQLFKTVAGDVCGGKLGEKSATSKILLREEARSEQITCVRLSGTACQCRKLDAEGNCTPDLSDDTGWGDNKFRCFGDDRRCLKGKCITCKGYVYDDGCDGCSAPPGSPSTLGCWHYGSDPELETAYTCNSTCSSYGGCIQANWNDDTDCNVCKHWWPDGNCTGWSHSFVPIYRNVLWVNQCNYRRAGDSQNCGLRGNESHSRRLCVCNY